MTAFSAWNILDLTKNQARDQTIQMARLAMEKDLSLRSWVSSLEGIYAPITPHSCPNECLPKAERDFTLPNGQEITKLNPAYVYRLVREHRQRNRPAQERHNAGYGRLVALKPICTQNIADEWEARALKELMVSGQSEKIEEVSIDGNTTIRLLRLVRAETSCLSCHTTQGLKEGDVLGGLSIIPPQNQVGTAYRELGKEMIFLLFLMAPLCLATVIFFTLRLLRSLRERAISTREKEALLVNMEDLVEKRTQELRASQHENNRERRLLRNVVEAAPAVMMVCDAEHNILACNPGAQNYLGLQVGGSCINIWEDRPAFEKLCAEVRQMQSCYRTPVMVRDCHEGERRFHMLLTASPVTYRNQPVILFWLQDFTTQTRLRLAAEASARSKSAFLAQMSHEIRTPLNAIIGMSQIAADNIGDTKKIQTSLKQIRASSRHLLGILNDILDLSKIESGKMQLTPAPNRLSTIHEDICNIIQNSCDEKRVRYVRPLDALPDIDIVFDKMRLDQVLINLLGNAVKFTPSGGEVSFGISLTAESPDSVTLAFRIADTGIGMSQEQIDRIFTPFEQADASTSRKFGGTGLGLSISRNLVQMMGGKISIESAPDQGSVFSFELTFPKSETAAEAQDDGQDPGMDGIDLHGKRILLVEDVLINREIVKEVLAATGADIVEAC
ncbi:MAG: ATP-binding protein, partial [Desulfovibrionaceae bacterium]|nr:ATP-binding protein [Desulfovibrionaceae bacterium]